MPIAKSRTSLARTLLVSAAALVCVQTGEAFAQESRTAVATAAPQADTRRFAMRDGTQLQARVFGENKGPAIVMIHGVAGDGAALAALAARLNRETGAQVVVLDLRGHGQSGGAKWRVDHVGQYEEDVADVITAVRAGDASRRVVLAGHSMGGGIALRFALSKAAPSVDGYLLIAPLFGGDSPTMRKPSKEEARAAEAFVQFRTGRLIGVMAANAVGIRAFNDAPIMVFKQGAQAAYGWTALQSMQPNRPKDYRAALAAIKVPLLVIAGSKDESFDASRYAGVVSRYSPSGRTQLVDGATHGGVLFRPESARIAGEWLTAGSAAPFTVAAQ